jgi:hypothetical protein
VAGIAAKVDFALSPQAPREIHHVACGAVDRMALLTGSSSVFMSIKCALAIAQVLGRSRPGWESALSSARPSAPNRICST